MTDHFVEVYHGLIIPYQELLGNYDRSWPSIG